MSPAQIERFQIDGFLVLDNLFSTCEVEAMIAACSAPEDNLWKDAQETVHTLILTQRNPLFLALARDRRIVELLLPLLGPDIRLQSSKLAAKPLARNAGPFGWHQDFAYFPHTNTDVLAVMVMLDDARPQNGCMSMVRGSHRLGLLEHDSQGWFTGVCQRPLWEEQPADVVAITPRAGGISMHHCLTLHGSPANLSGQPRRGIVLEYRAADAFQLGGNISADNGLQIAGDAAPSVRCETGTWRLPKMRGRDNRGYGAAWNQEGQFAKEVNGPEA